MHTLDVWYFHVDAEAVLAVFEAASSRRAEKRAQKMVKKARTKTHQQTLDKLTEIEAGRRRIISDPPLLVPLREMSLDRHLDPEDLGRFTRASVEATWSNTWTVCPTSAAISCSASGWRMSPCGLAAWAAWVPAA